jgi:hypothetical protein
MQLHLAVWIRKQSFQEGVPVMKYLAIIAVSAIALSLSAPVFAKSINAATRATPASVTGTVATPGMPGNPRAAANVSAHRKMGRMKTRNIHAATPAIPARSKAGVTIKATPGNLNAEERTGR